MIYQPQWRMVGEERKADHIIDLCARNGLVSRNLLEVGAGDGAILMWLGKRSFCKAMHAVEISRSGVDVILDQHIRGLVSCQHFDGYNLHSRTILLILPSFPMCWSMWSMSALY